MNDDSDSPTESDAVPTGGEQRPAEATSEQDSRPLGDGNARAREAPQPAAAGEGRAGDEEWPDLAVTLPMTPGDGSAPVMAQLAAESPDAAGESTPIRTGSPFAVDPVPLGPFATDRPIETVIDGGPLKYTAMGSTAAAIMVLAFAAVAAWQFPIGGTLIAGLGCLLSVFGLYSNYRFAAASTLLFHLALFVVSYSRTLG